MSFLTPLYILGTLAILGPILFHLIRRIPKGRVPFSSLMFLSPAPPRLTRKSRIDNWLLLLLRALAVALLALAFARPFLREVEGLTAPLPDGRRLLLLIDTSASMRRGDLWPRAKSIAIQAFETLRPGDQLAILSFDDRPRTLLSFGESAAFDPPRIRELAAGRIEPLAPSWGATDLGQALVEACGALENLPDQEAKGARMPRRVVLITDLQRGTKLDALGGFEWPNDIEVELHTVSDDRSNASLHWLVAPEQDDRSDRSGLRERRVRVSNQEGSKRDQFKLTWDVEGAPPPVLLYVPPGESRVARVPTLPSLSPRGTLRLEGDEHPFDNSITIAEEAPATSTILFLGADDRTNPTQHLYYLDRVFQDMPGRQVLVEALGPASELSRTLDHEIPLVVMTSTTTDANLASLRERVSAGASLLLVLTDATSGEALGSLLGLPAIDVHEVTGTQDQMLGQIDFSHPLFAPLSAPQFNDFTKIRFWKYRRLNADSIPNARVVARFESGDPALVDISVGQGRVYVLTSGWQPADSQLARSSKFVPLMGQILLSAERRPPGSTLMKVHEPLPLQSSSSGPRTLTRPDGSRLELAPDASVFTGTDQPGLYSVEEGGTTRWFAVNLDPAEGLTAPLAAEVLEQRGCRLSTGPVPSPDPEKLRQLRNSELEARQKLWRWLVLAALALLIVETFLAGRKALSRPASTEALPA